MAITFPSSTDPERKLSLITWNSRITACDAFSNGNVLRLRITQKHVQYKKYGRSAKTQCATRGLTGWTT